MIYTLNLSADEVILVASLLRSEIGTSLPPELRVKLAEVLEQFARDIRASG